MGNLQRRKLRKRKEETKTRRLKDETTYLTTRPQISQHHHTLGSRRAQQILHAHRHFSLGAYVACAVPYDGLMALSSNTTE
jgi:hypothetical protein